MTGALSIDAQIVVAVPEASAANVAVYVPSPLSLVALAIYMPWFVACARAMGSDNILYELYAQNFARFTAADRGHGALSEPQ